MEGICRMCGAHSTYISEDMYRCIQLYLKPLLLIIMCTSSMCISGLLWWWHIDLEQFFDMFWYCYKVEQVVDATVDATTWCNMCTAQSTYNIQYMTEVWVMSLSLSLSLPIFICLRCILVYLKNKKIDATCVELRVHTIFNAWLKKCMDVYRCIWRIRK